MRPGPLIRWILATVRTEVTFGATATRTAAKEVAAMASRTAVDISYSCISVEGSTFSIQPGLANRVSRTDMTIMTRRRAVIVKPARCVTLGTDFRGIGKVR